MRPSRGRPLGWLGLFVAGWVGMRIVLLSGLDAPAGIARFPAETIAGKARPRPAPVAAQAVPAAIMPAARVAWQASGALAAESLPRRALAFQTPVALHPAGSAGLAHAAMPNDPLGIARAFLAELQQGVVRTPPAPPVALGGPAMLGSTRTSRVSVDAWILARRDGGADRSIAPAAQYGGTQAGAVLR